MNRFRKGAPQEQVMTVMNGRVSDLQTRIDTKDVADAIKQLKPVDLAALVKAIQSLRFDVDVPAHGPDLELIAKTVAMVAEAVDGIQINNDGLVEALNANTRAITAMREDSQKLRECVDGVADALARPKTITRDRNGNIESIE